MYIYTLLLRMTDTMTSQNIDLSLWDTLYSLATDNDVKLRTHKKRNVPGGLEGTVTMRRERHLPYIVHSIMT
jgi:hypothetical protein